MGPNHILKTIWEFLLHSSKFFGTDELFVPLFGNTPEAADAFPNADVFINFASFRSAYSSSMEALQIPSIRVVCIFDLM